MWDGLHLAAVSLPVMPGQLIMLAGGCLWIGYWLGLSSRR